MKAGEKFAYLHYNIKSATAVSFWDATVLELSMRIGRKISFNLLAVF